MHVIDHECGTDPSTDLGSVFFETFVKHVSRKVAEGIIDSTQVDEQEVDRWVREEERRWLWEEMCADEVDLILGEEMVREIWWALHGMEFAQHRLSLLHFTDFDDYAGLIEPGVGFVGVAAFEAEVEDETMRAYRSILTLYTIQELFFWMAAVWDRMGHFLNLFAFGVRNVAQSKDVWRQVFERFRVNYADVVEVLAENGDYRALKRLNDRVYQYIQDRRNFLAHKGTLAGRIQAGSEDDALRVELYKKFVLDGKAWDLSNIMQECSDLCDKCHEAFSALLCFTGGFLKWRSAH
jgi:hypothetical protein